ncbi:MAG: RIO1 family regulatory kinase/ATPase [Thermoproteus sp. AZ2]|jgi:putative serine/threonine protein kinase|uniref:RIO1 family regulatory kinase/ATPase n=1 Tax=Thermoproteus sp. AZ2 TaxID=1609232 RepID=A0ACC6V365_9CREN|nr:MAG: serine/threonine protein kinase [Thermoproteus sp. AZ2]
MRLEVALALTIGGDLRHATRVWRQLEDLGLAVELGGSIAWGEARVLGKGNNSVVLLCRDVRGRRLACKIRRGDAQRPSLLDEAFYLSLANQVSVGPRLIAYSRDVIAMEYVDGVPIPSWWASASRGERISVARQLLEQAFALDELGLSHGELSRPGDHVLIRGGKPVIIDFESASLSRRSRNVLQVANMLRALGLSIPLDVLKKYGEAPSREALEAIELFIGQL